MPFSNVFGAKIIRHTLNECRPLLIRIGPAHGLHRQVVVLVGPQRRIQPGCSREDPFSPPSEIQRSHVIPERQRCTIDASHPRRSSLLTCHGGIDEEIGNPQPERTGDLVNGAAGETMHQEAPVIPFSNTETRGLVGVTGTSR